MMAPMNFHKTAIRYTINAWKQLQAYICLICIMNTTEWSINEIAWSQLKKTCSIAKHLKKNNIFKFKVKVASLENLQSSCFYHFKFVIKVYRGRIAKTELLSKYLWN